MIEYIASITPRWPLRVLLGIISSTYSSTPSSNRIVVTTNINRVITRIAIVIVIIIVVIIVISLILLLWWSISISTILILLLRRREREMVTVSVVAIMTLTSTIGRASEQQRFVFLLLIRSDQMMV